MIDELQGLIVRIAIIKKTVLLCRSRLSGHNAKMFSINFVLINLLLLKFGRVDPRISENTGKNSSVIVNNEVPGTSLKLFQPYEIVKIQINDPSDRSAGIYFRISQKGVDYLASLTSEGLPLIFHRMVLPTISESGFSIKDAVVTSVLSLI